VVKKNIEKRVTATAGGIMVGLQGHKAPEQRIEYIQYGKNGFPYPVMDLTHEKANLRGFAFMDCQKLVKAG
jgi:hypothetical protein